MKPLKNANGRHACLPIFVNLKSNTMKKSQCKDTAFINSMQVFSDIFVLIICYITYIYSFRLFLTQKLQFFIAFNIVEFCHFAKCSFCALSLSVYSIKKRVVI